MHVIKVRIHNDHAIVRQDGSWRWVLEALKIQSTYMECPICATLVMSGTARCPRTGAEIARVLEAWRETQCLAYGFALAMWSAALVVVVVMALLGVLSSYVQQVVLAAAFTGLTGGLIWKLGGAMKPS